MTTDRATLHYILSRARIYFADEHIACDYCPCLETYSRKQCRLTGEYLLDTRTIGYNCPLEFAPEGDVGETIRTRIPSDEDYLGGWG